MNKGIIFIVLFQLPLIAQWEPDVRLTNDPAPSYTTGNNAWAIASIGSSIHIAWSDKRIGDDYEIFYKRSTDNGASWTADTRLTNSPGYSANPTIAVSGQLIHIVWQELRDGNWEMYYKRSSDGGISWGSDVRLTNEPAESKHPSMIVSGQTVHVVWDDMRDRTNNLNNIEIYYKRSTDGGISWEPDARLTNDTNYSTEPSISLSGQTVHIVWTDNRGSGPRIFYKYSSNDGASWGNEVMLSTGTLGSYQPSVSAAGQNIAVAWNDLRDLNGYFEIYSKSSTDGGSTWSADTRLTNAPLVSAFPSVAVSGQNVHIAWRDDRFGNGEIFYKLSTDAGINWGPDLRLTDSPGLSEGASVSLSGSNVFVAWYDSRNGNFEIYFKKNPTGNITGITHVHSEVPDVYKLKQNYPNPFNPSTKIQFSIPKQSSIMLKVYDVRGRVISSLIDNLYMNTGTYEYYFESNNLASGIYYYSLYSGGTLIDTKKMVLLK